MSEPIEGERVVDGQTRSHNSKCFLGHSAYVLGWIALLAACTGCNMSARMRNTRGVREYRLGKYNEAMQKFQRALAADPNNADAYYNLASTYYMMAQQNGDRSLMQQSEGLYHQCLDNDPDHVACYRGLASLLVATDRKDSAFTMMRRWGERSYGSAEPRIELARLYEEFGEKDAAVQCLTDALQVDAKNSRAWAALGRLREEKGDYVQALADYQQSYDLNRFQPGISQRIASLQKPAPNSGQALPPSNPMGVPAPPQGNSGPQLVNTPQSLPQR